jgi:hypothetical protein
MRWCRRRAPARSYCWVLGTVLSHEALGVCPSSTKEELAAALEGHVAIRIILDQGNGVDSA